jgi:hypothetical protein
MPQPNKKMGNSKGSDSQRAGMAATRKKAQAKRTDAKKVDKALNDFVNALAKW